MAQCETEEGEEGVGLDDGGRDAAAEEASLTSGDGDGEGGGDGEAACEESTVTLAFSIFSSDFIVVSLSFTCSPSSCMLVRRRIRFMMYQ